MKAIDSIRNGTGPLVLSGGADEQVGVVTGEHPGGAVVAGGTVSASGVRIGRGGPTGSLSTVFDRFASGVGDGFDQFVVFVSGCRPGFDVGGVSGEVGGQLDIGWDTRSKNAFNKPRGERRSVVTLECAGVSGQVGYAASGVWYVSNASSGVLYPRLECRRSLL